MSSQIVGTVLLLLTMAVLGVTVYSFVHAAMQRPDAFTAADKLTKPVWLVILGISGLLSMVLGIMGSVIAAVAAGVYLVDVRPKILEIQGKSH